MAQREADVLIIGAGVIGCAVAFELAEAGVPVRVIDARRPGQGASQASAGVLAPYVEGHGSPLLRALGRRSLDAYPEFVARASRASGQPVELDRIGTLEVATSAEQQAALRRSAAELAGEGVETHWIDRPGLVDAEPHLTPAAVGALHIPIHAAVNLPALTAALAAAATASGAVFESGVAASRLAADGDAVAVHTAGGVLRARDVVLAAGTWAPGLVPPGSSSLPVRPVRGQILYLQAPPLTLRHVVWGTDVYLVPWADGTVLAGATSEDVGFDERVTAAGVAGLLEAATRLVPELAGATFVEARRGLRPGSPDDLPYVGRSAALPGVIYACGHYRNGALLAPLTATLVAGIVGGDGADPALAALAPGRAGRL